MYGVDPKVASDQRGHGIGVSIEVYTSSDIEQKRAAANKLEAAVFEGASKNAGQHERTGLNGVNGVTRNRWVFLSV